MPNVVVTGASRGIGLGIAKSLAAAGYTVIGVARSRTKELDAAIGEAERSGLGALHFEPFDLSETAKLSALVKTLRKKHGAIYGLVNNAAVGTEAVLATMHDSRIENLIRINLLSPIFLTKYVVRSMMADGAGRVVNIASIVGFSGHTGLSVYAATKAGLIGFTRSLAREVGRLGINVNAVAPGFIDTDMTRAMDAETRLRLARRSALKRFAEVKDVANAVEYLLGEKSRNVTGTVMTVDAGATV
jgi:3-oxoacyl-[acyl-carrier protein] reductase